MHILTSLLATQQSIVSSFYTTLMVFCVFFLGAAGTHVSFAQTGIGTPMPDSDAMLEIESNDKGVLIPRLELVESSQPTPLANHVAGMIVYNTATSRTGTADQVSPGFYFNDGTRWLRTLTTTDAASGGVSTVQNGLFVDSSGSVMLGGALTQPTDIATDATNTLAISGLEQIPPDDQHDIVVTDKATGVLKRTPLNSLVHEEVKMTTATADGQDQFTTPLPISSIHKINVFRNGVRVDFTKVNDNTIKLEPGALCYKNDEIRIVQIY